MAAWKEFRRGKRKKPDVLEFEFNLENNLFDLHELLLSKTYQPDHYTPFYVCDPKLRLIHKATVRDRVLHQAIFRVLYSVFDQQFISDSYSCRLGKGTHRGILRLEKFIRQISRNYCQPVYALKCDVRKFFDSIDQHILLELITHKITDQDALWLISKIIFSYTSGPGRGLPLGNVTSQLFANIYLNEVDWFIKKDLYQKYYLRYCDDFLILDLNKEKLSALLPEINNFLFGQLKLNLHPNKITLRKNRQGIDFLGYVILPHYRALRTKTKKRVLKRVNEINFQSYLGVLRHCHGFKIFRKML